MVNFLYLSAEVLTKFVTAEDLKKSSDLALANFLVESLKTLRKFANYFLKPKDRMLLVTIFQQYFKKPLTFSKTAYGLSKSLNMPLSSVKWKLHKLLDLGLLHFEYKKKLTLTNSGLFLASEYVKNMRDDFHE